MKILMADKNSVVRDSAVESLNLAGYRDVQTFDTGTALMDKLQAGIDADIIITGHRTGGVSGLDILTFVRSDERYRDIPVIVYSGDNVEAAVKAAGGTYLAKVQGNLADFIARKFPNP